jgi:hypothetical protein
MTYVEPEETELDVYISSSKFNKCVAAIKELWRGVTAGDMEYYTGATGKARLPIGVPGQKYAVNAGATAPELVNGGITLIEEFIATGAEATYTFAAIPQIYSHLKLIAMGRSSWAGNYETLKLQFNADAGGNYNVNNIWVNNNTFVQTYIGGAAYAYGGYLPAATATANYPGVSEIVIPNYTNSTFYKTAQTMVSFLHAANIGGCDTGISHTVWLNDDPITAIKAFLSDDEYVAGTILSLYGMF